MKKYFWAFMVFLFLGFMAVGFTGIGTHVAIGGGVKISPEDVLLKTYPLQFPVTFTGSGGGCPARTTRLLLDVMVDEYERPDGTTYSVVREYHYQITSSDKEIKMKRVE